MNISNSSNCILSAIRINFLLASMLLVLAISVPANAKGVILNFNEVDISTMVKFISDLTGKNMVMDDRVKGKISVYSPSKLTNEEAFSLFTSVLELKGFTVTQAGKLYKVVPLSSARQSTVQVIGQQSTKHVINEGYVAQILPLDGLSAVEALPLLQPLVSKDGHIAAFGPGNMLLVVDSAMNIHKLSEILKNVDVSRRRGGGELIYLKHATADSILSMLKDWHGGGKQTAVATVSSITQSASDFGVIADHRLNALLVFGSSKEKDNIRKMVAMLDVAPPDNSGKINVYYLENADAVETAKVLEGVIKGIQSSTTATASNGTAVRQSSSDGKITVTPDKASNSLVIMADQADYQNIEGVIKRLDKRSRQVFVEAVVAEVSLDKLDALGVKWGGFGGYSSRTISTAGIFDPMDAVTPLGSLIKSLKDVGIDTSMTKTSSVNIYAVLNSLNSKGIVNVLSTPTLLTTDNKEAEIFVGQNVPFLGKIDSLASGITQQSVERKDTGITLKIKPQISQDEYVKLDIYQEISAIKEGITIGQQSNDLITTKRSAKTSVVVRDSEPVVIGGLIQDTDEKSTSKIPLLGDIPGLGWMFKTDSTTRKRTNLLIILTPHVIKNAKDLAGITNRQRALFEDVSKNGK